MLRRTGPPSPTGRHPGLRISSTRCRWGLVAFLLACAPAAAAAEVYVPVDGYASYVDANGIFTVIGNVQNDGERTVSALLAISAQDGNLTHTISFRHHPIPAGQELPFRVKMPGVPPDAILLEPEVASYARAVAPPTGMRVIYDETLVLHGDGHLSGRVTNSGNGTLYNPTVWAVVHGMDGMLDVVRNAHAIGTLEPGQTAGFAMYPDPSISEIVTYYSCFAPSQSSVIPLKADRNGDAYDMRYESGAWFYRPEFSADGTEVTIQTTNSYPWEMPANLEVPAVTRDEVFEVYLNGEPVQYIQSIDEMGMWHLAFSLKKYSQEVVTIRGFVAGQVLPPMVPEYIRDDAAGWATGLVGDDDILDDLRLLADRRMIPPGPGGDPLMPPWMKTAAGWYGAGQLTHGEFLAMVSYMVERGIILLG